MTQFGSDDFTLGVEEEYQLVDPESGELRSRARAVLAMDWTGEIKPEMQQNTVEVDTCVCPTAADVRTELSRLRLQAAVAAESGGLRVVAAGTHPFSHWSGQEFTPSPVYERLRSEYRQLAESQTIFGLHIHVSIPPAHDRVRVMNVVRRYLPHLLALSASSPLFLGEDTGYASFRSILWRRWPRTGPPPRFADEAEFQHLLRELIATRRIDAPGRLYWELRPHHVYPTLEYRVADVTPRLEDAVVIAALARAITAAAATGVLTEPRLSESFLHSFMVENAWRASRDALGAELVDLSSGSPRLVVAREAVLRLAETVEPLARELGDADALAGLPALIERGDAALRIRDRFRAAPDPAALVRWLADETVLGLGMDRRHAQRDPAAVVWTHPSRPAAQPPPGADSRPGGRLFGVSLNSSWASVETPYN